MTAKRQYYRIALRIARVDPAWLRRSAANPSPTMRPIHVRLCLLALRNAQKEIR